MKSDSASEGVEVDQADAHLRGPAGLHVRVVGDDLHAERREPLRDQHADPAEADDADGLLVELDAGVLRALPLAVAQRRVRGRRRGGRRPASGATASSAAETMLEVGALTTITPDWVAAAHVDVVEADPGTGDDLQARRGGERLGVHLGRRAHQERVDVGDRGEQLGRSAPLQVRMSKSGPSASTVAGLSSSAMRTTGRLTGRTSQGLADVDRRPPRGNPWRADRSCTTLCPGRHPTPEREGKCVAAAVGAPVPSGVSHCLPPGQVR